MSGDEQHESAVGVAHDFRAFLLGQEQRPEQHDAATQRPQDENDVEDDGTDPVHSACLIRSRRYLEYSFTISTRESSRHQTFMSSLSGRTGYGMISSPGTAVSNSSSAR